MGKKIWVTCFQRISTSFFSWNSSTLLPSLFSPIHVLGGGEEHRNFGELGKNYAETTFSIILTVLQHISKIQNQKRWNARQKTSESTLATSILALRTYQRIHPYPSQRPALQSLFRQSFCVKSGIRTYPTYHHFLQKINPGIRIWQDFLFHTIKTGLSGSNVFPLIV